MVGDLSRRLSANGGNLLLFINGAGSFGFIIRLGGAALGATNDGDAATYSNRGILGERGRQLI